MATECRLNSNTTSKIIDAPVYLITFSRLVTLKPMAKPFDAGRLFSRPFRSFIVLDGEPAIN